MKEFHGLLFYLFGTHLSHWQTASVAIPEVWKSDQSNLNSYAGV
ncbi:hypothetical protein [Vibrio hyugaensis]|nr:hypothetical protein [Vibrio hyugaensis]